MDIDGKVALVTGAGAGIGRATALRLAAEGAAVVAADIDPAGAATANEIAARGGRAVFARGDTANEEDLRGMIAAARSLGGLDILVNNAGVVEGLTTQRQSFPDIEPARWQRMLQVNLGGVILGTQLAIEVMRAHRGGAIVNIASMAGIGHGVHFAPVYAASKAAVVRFSAALAGLAPSSRIRVNCVCPDWVRTPMVERARAETPPELWAQIAPAVMLAPEDIADAVTQLVRDEDLAGRVMLCLKPGGPHPILPATRRRGEDDGDLE